MNICNNIVTSRRPTCIIELHLFVTQLQTCNAASIYRYMKLNNCKLKISEIKFEIGLPELNYRYVQRVAF